MVFGAAFDNEFQLVHTEIEKLEDLEVLRGSKYVQSEIGNAYMMAKEYLDVGRKVLFTGTPCQIAGLYAFLNRDYDGLYTQDIICHGVPSPLVWRKYVKHREDKASSQLEQMSFRYKKHGWRMYSVRFKFSNNSEYEKVLSDDPYMRGFLSNLTLRPSCYSCAFKTKSRVSDFTLADFWGVDKVLPTIDDDKGTSLVLLHSEKAQRLFEEIGEGISRWEASIDEAIRYNSAMVKSVAPHAGREGFFNQIRDREFGCIKPYIKIPLMQRIKRTIRRLLRAVRKA